MGAYGSEAAQAEVAAWIAAERAGHAGTKYGDDQEFRQRMIDGMRSSGYTPWDSFVANYLKRVSLFGLATPQGRQALGKAITSLLHCLETAVDVHGHMPEPSHPSGEIRSWLHAACHMLAHTDDEQWACGTPTTTMDIPVSDIEPGTDWCRLCLAYARGQWTTEAGT